MVLWSRDTHEVTWQFEKLIFLLSKDLWPINLTSCLLMGGSSACKSLTLWVFLVFIKISINYNVGFSRFYMTDQFWQSVFFVFWVQVVFEFVNVGKTLAEMLYGYVNSHYTWPNNFPLKWFCRQQYGSGKLHNMFTNFCQSVVLAE